MSKILFFDLDGTLLTTDKQISPGNRAALKRMLAQGHRAVITTGRYLPSALEQARRLELHGPGCYLIAYNGGLVYDLAAEKTLFRQTLPMDAALAAMAICRELGIHVQAYDQRHVLVIPPYDKDTLHRYCRIMRADYRVVSALTEEPCKLLAASYHRPDELKKLEQALKSRLDSAADCFFTCPNYLEVVPKGISKGSAATRLCKMLGIPLADSVAVGDAENDISMIRSAGVGVAMANGSDEAKAAADDVTTRDNDHDGVAEVIEKWILGAGMPPKVS